MKMAFELNDLKGFLFLVVLTVPLTSSTNINCRGKPFHCLNSTHFMICVDLGGGVSSTIDDFVIQCPPTTVCDANNIFECEFPKIEEPLYVIGVSKASDDTTLPPIIDTTTSTPIDMTNVKAPIEKNTETVLSQQEPIIDPWPEDILEDLKEEFVERKEKLFDLPVIAEISTVSYSIEGMLTTNRKAFERNNTNQNISTTKPTLNTSTVTAVDVYEIINTSAIYNTRHMSNETTTLPDRINLNISSNETHKEEANFSYNVQPVITNNKKNQSEVTVNIMNETRLNTTLFDSSTDPSTNKNIKEEIQLTTTENEVHERPFQNSSTTILPHMNTDQVELNKPPTAPSKQFDVLPHDQNLTSTNAMLNDVSNATFFRIESGLEISTKHGALVTVVNNSLTHMLQDATMFDDNVAPTTEVTGKTSELFDKSSLDVAKDINDTALPLPAKEVQASTVLKSSLSNNTVLVNNNSVTTEHKLDGSFFLRNEIIEMTTSAVPNINQVMDRPGLLFSVGGPEVTNKTTDLPTIQVQEHKLISPGYYTVGIKDETINSTNTTDSYTNQGIKHNVDLTASTTEVKNEVINKTTETEKYVGLNPSIAKEDIDKKNSTISSFINMPKFVQKSEATNKTDTPDTSFFLVSTKNNFTTVMPAASATDAPQVIIPDNTGILSENIHLNKTRNEISKESLSANIKPRTKINIIVQGEHNNYSVDDMNGHIPNTTFITTETITYSDNDDNKIKLPDNINLTLDVNLGNASTSNNSTDMLSENVSKVIIDSGNDTKITTLSATGSKKSHDKDNFTIYYANENILTEVSFVSTESTSSAKINEDYIQNNTNSTVYEDVNMNFNVTKEIDIKSILSSSTQSNNVSKEYSAKENNQNMLPTVLDKNGGVKVDRLNEEPLRLNSSLHILSNNSRNNNESVFNDKVVLTEYSSTSNYVTPAFGNTAKQKSDTTSAVPNDYDTTTVVTNLQDTEISNIFKHELNSPHDNIATVSLNTNHISDPQNSFQLENTSTLLSDIVLKTMEITTKADVNSKINDSNKINDTESMKTLFGVVAILNTIHISENTNEKVNKTISLTPELIEMTNKSNIINTTGPNINRQSHIIVNDSIKPEPIINTENLETHDHTLKLFTGIEKTLHPNLTSVTNIDQLNDHVSTGALNITYHNVNTTATPLARSTNIMANDSNNTAMQIKRESISSTESIQFNVYETTDKSIVNDINVATTNNHSSIALVTEPVKVKAFNITAVTQSNNLNKAVAEKKSYVSTDQSNIKVLMAKTTEPNNIQINTRGHPSNASIVIGELKNDNNLENTGADKIHNLMIAETSTFEQESPLLIIESPHTESTRLPIGKLASGSKSLTLPTATGATISEQITSAPASLGPTRLLKDSSKMDASTLFVKYSDINNNPVTEPPSIVETINFKYVEVPIHEEMTSVNIMNTSTHLKNNIKNLIGEAEVAIINQNMSLASERQGNASIREDLYFENKNTSISPTIMNIDLNIENINNNNTSNSSSPINDNVSQSDKTSSNTKFVIHNISTAKTVNSIGSAAVEAVVTIPHLTHNDKSTNKSLSNLWPLRNTTTNESKHSINVSDTDKVNNNSDEYSKSPKNTKVNLTNHMKNNTNTGKELANSSTNNQIKPNNSEPVFDCSTHPRGKYADSKDCRKFYTCFGIIEPTIGICPNHTVFSEINKQCTRNLSHCVRNNQFRCMYEGRFSDFLKDNIYYICVKNGHHGFLRYTLQCQSGYHLNKANVKCMENEKEVSQSASSGDEKSKPSEDKPSIKSKDDDKSSNKMVECKKEGLFPYPKDCRKYYVCSKTSKDEYRRKIKKCSSDEVYDIEDKKCVSAESTEC